MIVGNGSITIADVESHSASADVLIEYSDSLIPEEYKHIKEIRDNQRYLCCLLLRQSSTVPWDRKKEILDRVLYDTRITGFTDSVVEARSVWDFVDRSRLEMYRRKYK